MEDNELVYINKDDDDGSDAEFWAAYLVDDDSGVAPLLLADEVSDDEPVN